MVRKLLEILFFKIKFANIRNHIKETDMLATTVVNMQLNKMGLPQQVVSILEKELGWVQVLDILIFLRTESQCANSRPHNISALERKLICTNGLWVKRTKQIIDVLMAHDIL